MKRFLLSTVFFMCINFSGYSQIVDLIGIGVNDKLNSTLTLDDIGSIDKVEAFATSKGLGVIPPPDGVTFNNNEPTSSSVWKAIQGAEYLSPTHFDPSIGTYSRTFNLITSTNLNVNIKPEVKFDVHSFYVFVFRNDSGIDYKFKSFFSTIPVFYYRNGSSGAYKYSIPINTSNASRDAVVKIPISEISEDGRKVIINISTNSGEIDETYIEETNNQGNSLSLFEYPISNIPGNINELIVSIYSPNPYSGEQKGDSFFSGGVVIDIDKTFDGCTYTQGYWKNHSNCKTNGNGNGNGPAREDTWDLIPGGAAEETIFFLSEQDYCEVFDTNSGKGGKYYILAHQYVAAQLNLLNNSDPTDVADAFNEATEFLNNHSPSDVKGNKSLEADCVRLGGILDDFNNGRIGPGHCDEDDNTDEEEQNNTKTKKKVSIYPNPANNLGKISFIAKQEGTSSVELYNIGGRKVATLFNGKTKKNDEVVVEYDASAFKSGLYFTIIKNGSDIYKDKISIIK